MVEFRVIGCGRLLFVRLYKLNGHVNKKGLVGKTGGGPHIAKVNVVTSC